MEPRNRRAEAAARRERILAKGESRMSRILDTTKPKEAQNRSDKDEAVSAVDDSASMNPSTLDIRKVDTQQASSYHEHPETSTKTNLSLDASRRPPTLESASKETNKTTASQSTPGGNKCTGRDVADIGKIKGTAANGKWSKYEVERIPQRRVVRGQDTRPSIVEVLGMACRDSARLRLCVAIVFALLCSLAYSGTEVAAQENKTKSILDAFQQGYKNSLKNFEFWRKPKAADDDDIWQSVEKAILKVQSTLGLPLDASRFRNDVHFMVRRILSMYTKQKLANRLRFLVQNPPIIILSFVEIAIVLVFLAILSCMPGYVRSRNKISQPSIVLQILSFFPGVKAITSLLAVLQFLLVTLLDDTMAFVMTLTLCQIVPLGDYSQLQKLLKF